MIETADTQGLILMDHGSPDPLDIYLQDVTSTPVTRIGGHNWTEFLNDQGDGPEARSRLAAGSTALVISLTKRYWAEARERGIAPEDVVGAANVRLMVAARNFNPDMGLTFGTFVYNSVAPYIAYEVLRSESSRPETVFSDLIVDGDEIDSTWEERISEEEGFSRYDGNPLRIVLEREEGRERVELLGRVHSALASLPERERIAITARFQIDGGPEMTLQEIADKLPYAYKPRQGKGRSHANASAAINSGLRMIREAILSQ